MPSSAMVAPPTYPNMPVKPAAVPAAFKPRLLVPAPLERQFGAWIGGSIMSSLGTFVPLWFTKQEYEEQGASYIESKCA